MLPRTPVTSPSNTRSGITYTINTSNDADKRDNGQEGINNERQNLNLLYNKNSEHNNAINNSEDSKENELREMQEAIRRLTQLVSDIKNQIGATTPATHAYLGARPQDSTLNKPPERDAVGEMQFQEDWMQQQYCLPGSGEPSQHFYYVPNRLDRQEIKFQLFGKYDA